MIYFVPENHFSTEAHKKKNKLLRFYFTFTQYIRQGSIREANPLWVLWNKGVSCRRKLIIGKDGEIRNWKEKLKHQRKVTNASFWSPDLGGQMGTYLGIWEPKYLQMQGEPMKESWCCLWTTMLLYMVMDMDLDRGADNWEKKAGSWRGETRDEQECLWHIWYHGCYFISTFQWEELVW